MIASFFGIDTFRFRTPRELLKPLFFCVQSIIKA